MSRLCPRHADIRDCPLYHGAHEPGPNCLDVDLAPLGKCLGSNRAVYDRILAALKLANPELVFECESAALLRQSARQRAANMRAAGIH